MTIVYYLLELCHLKGMPYWPHYLKVIKKIRKENNMDNEITADCGTLCIRATEYERCV